MSEVPSTTLLVSDPALPVLTPQEVYTLAITATSDPETPKLVTPDPNTDTTFDAKIVSKIDNKLEEVEALLISSKGEIDNFIEALPDPNTLDDGKSPKGLWLSETANIVATIYIYKNVKTQDINSFQLDPLPLENRKVLDLVEFPVTAEFSLPSREQLNRYRDRSSKWNNDINGLVANRYTLRSLIIRYHLNAIDLPDPVTGNRISLTKDIKGRLSATSEALLEKLHPSLLDYLMLKFERLANLIY